MNRRCEDCGKPAGGRYARYCAADRWRHRGKPVKWAWTPERVALLRSRYVGGERGTAATIAETLGFPRWVVTRKAAELGISKPYVNRVKWTEAEAAFLMEHAGVRPIAWIARKLRRTVVSVAMRAKHQEIRVGLRDGYTMRELELCFGEDHKVIRRWIDAGKLRAQTRGYAGRDPLAVTDVALWDFVTKWPTAFDLRRVDQHWFMGLVISQGGARRGVELLAEVSA